MLDKFEVRTAQGTLLSFPMGDSSGGYEVRDIQGLDPVEATISSSTFAGVPGSQFHSAQLADRNITMKIGFKPDYVTTSVKSLRNRLSSFFTPAEEINLRFYDDEGLTVDTFGRVEYCRAPLFAQKPGADISVVCFDPAFLGLSPVGVSGASVSDDTETVISYDGSADTGFEFHLFIHRDLSEFTIYARSPSGVLSTMDVAGTFQAADVLSITTITGAKSAILSRGGSDTSVLYAVSPQSSWYQLKQGDNRIRVYAEGAPVPYTITYTDRYSGL
jgi:hypothetical protein